jgi:hypothetical protein
MITRTSKPIILQYSKMPQMGISREATHLYTDFAVQLPSTQHLVKLIHTYIHKKDPGINVEGAMESLATSWNGT